LAALSTSTAGAVADPREEIWLLQPGDAAVEVPRNARLLGGGAPPRGVLELRAAGATVPAELGRVSDQGWTLVPRQPLPPGAACALLLDGRRVARFTTAATGDQRPPVLRVRGAARRTNHSATVCTAEGECMDPATRETCLWYSDVADDQAAPEALVALVFLGRKGDVARPLRALAHVQRAGELCVPLHTADRAERLCGRLELVDLAGNRTVSAEVCEPASAGRD
jgi:hypothetical protein